MQWMLGTRVEGRGSFLEAMKTHWSPEWHSGKSRGHSTSGARPRREREPRTLAGLGGTPSGL